MKKKIEDLWGTDRLTINVFSQVGILSKGFSLRVSPKYGVLTLFLPLYFFTVLLGAPLYGAGYRKDFPFASLGHFPPAFCGGIAWFLPP